MEKIAKGLSGLAGEYFVAGELTRRGHVVTMTLRNTNTFDLLVSNLSATRAITIQVKTNQHSRRSWILRDKAETTFSDTHFYVFVNLNGITDQPSYHVIPSAVVADYVKENHSTWLLTPGRKGQQHNDNSMRKFSDNEGEYLGAWNLLGL